jgi:ubiquinone/menaquinone biosynthesis C-methylase UbiE
LPANHQIVIADGESVESVRPHLKAWNRDYSSRGRLWSGGVKDLPNLPEGSVVLELGCGNGKTFSAMLGQPWCIVALDVSMAAVRLCSIHGPNRGAFLAADSSYLPFQNKSFDAVFAFHILGHVLFDDREMMAMEASRVLKDGGMLFFRDFEREDMRCGMGDEVEPKTYRRGQGVVTHYFTEAEAKSLFHQLKPISISIARWKMRIKDQEKNRSEVEAVFQKAVI